MERSEIILICVMAIIAIASNVWDHRRRKRQTEAILNYFRASQASHEDWLFNQLYSIAPGKVLKPDEIEPESVSKPATVYNPNKDPMMEFKGKKNDWG